jgi:hypothetical protein
MLREIAFTPHHFLPSTEKTNPFHVVEQRRKLRTLFKANKSGISIKKA